jgi:hypothetical protein
VCLLTLVFEEVCAEVVDEFEDHVRTRACCKKIKIELEMNRRTSETEWVENGKSYSTIVFSSL